MTTTYLEQSDGSCKFWQVKVDGSTTVVSWGKIGSKGTTSEKEHASSTDADQFAEKQINAKIKQGYAKATKNTETTPAEEAPTKRKSRTQEKEDAPETAPEPASPKKKAKTKAAKKEPKPKPKKAPAAAKEKEKEVKEKVVEKVVDTSMFQAPAYLANWDLNAKMKLNPNAPPIEWEVKFSKLSYGIYVNDTHVYTGSEDGLVQQFDKNGAVQKQYRLPVGVKCIVGDGDFLYVGCNDGSLYDITQGVPRLMSKIEEFSQVYWMDIRKGLIAASDSSGKVALVNSEGETVWVQQGTANGWMCLMDDTGIYHGNSGGVQKRQLIDGAEIWKSNKLYVLFGQQDENHVYACGSDKLLKLDKATGTEVTSFSTGGSSCAVSSDGKYVFTGELKVFNSDGTVFRDYKLGDIPMSMATSGDSLYCVGDKLIKSDFSEAAINKMQAGTWAARSFTAQTIAEIMPEESVAEVTDTKSGILCECVKEKGKLRVKVIAPGYNNSWNVQFPSAIREEGAKYVVEKIIDQGTFYRAWGDIKKVKQ